MQIYEDDYYIWLIGLVTEKEQEARSRTYTLLLTYLLNQEYEWDYELDKNRASAGLNLRTTYANSCGIYQDEMDAYGPCRVMEVLVAMADYISRIYGESTSHWFWEMINNFGMMKYSDSRFNLGEVLSIIRNWMNHQYEPNGKGSPFIITRKGVDATQMELWDQMTMYVNEQIPMKPWI